MKRNITYYLAIIIGMLISITACSDGSQIDLEELEKTIDTEEPEITLSFPTESWEYFRSEVIFITAEISDDTELEKCNVKIHYAGTKSLKGQRDPWVYEKVDIPLYKRKVNLEEFEIEQIPVRIQTGGYVLELEVFDKAGNSTVSSRNFIIK